MMTKEDIRHYINRYIYAFNKYNIFGGIITMLLAIMNGVIRINQNSFEISKTFIAILFLSISLISMKEALKKACDIKDNCDCSEDMFKYPYRHSNYEKCPKDKSINELLYGAKSSVTTHIVNFVYKYNILGALLALLISSLLTIISVDKSFFELTNILVLTFIFATTKIGVDFLLKSQNFCPCACPNDNTQCAIPNSKIFIVKKEKTPKDKKEIKKRKKKKVEKDIELVKPNKSSSFRPYSLQDIRDDIEYEVDRILEKKRLSQVVMNQKLKVLKNPIMKKIDVEENFKRSFGRGGRLFRGLRKSKDSNSLFGGAFLNTNWMFRKSYKRNQIKRKICENNIKNKTSKSETVAECINKIRKDKDLRDFFRNLLVDRKDYQCLVDSNSSAQLEMCLTDFLLRNPKMAIDVGSITKL